MSVQQGFHTVINAALTELVALHYELLFQAYASLVQQLIYTSKVASGVLYMHLKQ